MEYQRSFLEKRHTEVDTWFRHFRIDNLEDWFYRCGNASLWLMLVQLLHLIPKRFLTFSQHAPERIFGVSVKLPTYYVALLAALKTVRWYLYQISRKTSLQLFSLSTRRREVVSAMHCQERNDINNHRKENRDWHTRKFLCSTSLSKKKDDLSSWSPSREKLRLYVFCDRIIPSATLVHICWITYLFVSAPNLPYSSVYCRLQ